VMLNFKSKNFKSGLSFVEVLIAVSIFLIVSVSLCIGLILVS